MIFRKAIVGGCTIAPRESGGGLLEIEVLKLHRKVFVFPDGETLHVGDPTRTSSNSTVLRIPAVDLTSASSIKRHLRSNSFVTDMIPVDESLDVLAALVFFRVDELRSRTHLHLSATVEIMEEEHLYVPDEDEDEDEEAVRSSVSEKLRKEEGYDGGAECAVCLDELSPSSSSEIKGGGVIRLIPCNHVFHEACLLRWLGTRANCPLCRHELSWSS